MTKSIKDIYKKKEWLYNKYINEKLSSYEIANISTACSSTIRMWMKKYNIPRRSSKEALKGRICTEETKKKMGKAHKGHIVSSETRAKIRKTLMGHSVSEKTLEMLRTNILGKHHTKETKLKMSKIHKGQTAWNKGKKCPNISEALKGRMPNSIQEAGIWGHVKRGYYNINGKKIFFRSKWEANYALYLAFLVKQKQIKSWAYEEDVFIFNKIKSGTRSYRPDFKIYNNDNTIEYNEVKGWMNPRSKTQLKRMAKYYPNIKLLIIDKDVYNDIKNKLGKMLKFY